MSDRVMSRLGQVAEGQEGMITAGQAARSGISRVQLSRAAAVGALDRVARGVYRMAGAPRAEHEEVYATWLALGGAEHPTDGVPPVVAAGQSAAILHGLGDFYPVRHEFIVPARKTTRLPFVRLRVRALTGAQVTWASGIPVLTVEAMIADLVGQGTDLSLVTDTLADAIDQHRITAPRLLTEYLDPLSARNGYPGGVAFADSLQAAAGDGR